MKSFRLEYVNDRPSEDVEVILEGADGTVWACSFVATVPHWCESPRIFGDLFECRLEAIDGESIPIPPGSVQEAGVIGRLETFANAVMPPEEQLRLRTARFTRMTFEMTQKSSLLWFIKALRDRRSRHSNAAPESPA